MSFVKRWIPISPAEVEERTKFPPRLLFEAIFIKFAFNFPWEELPRLFHDIHPDLPPLSRWKCSSFYSELYNSGFLQGVYRQLYLHLRQYGGTPLEEKILSGCFQLDDSAVFLASGSLSPGRTSPPSSFSSAPITTSGLSSAKAGGKISGTN